MKDIDLHVGYNPMASKARVLDAIRRAEGGAVEPESHVSFESWEGLSRALSGKRLELLRHIRQNAAASVAELARALGRRCGNSGGCGFARSDRRWRSKDDLR